MDSNVAVKPMSALADVTLEDLDYLLEDESMEEGYLGAGPDMDLEGDTDDTSPPKPSTSAVAIAASRAIASDGSKVTDPIPRLSKLPFEPSYRRGFQPSVVLNTFSEEWAMQPEYNLTRNVPDTGPMTYNVDLQIGFRSAQGTGATIAEAKEAAAGKCLTDLRQYIPPDRVLNFKPVVTTDAEKDILYVLEQTCKTRKLRMPKFRVQAAEGLANKFVGTATLGEFSEFGIADKNRVAVRLAAVKLYDVLRAAYNSGKLPDSVKQSTLA